MLLYRWPVRVRGYVRAGEPAVWSLSLLVSAKLQFYRDNKRHKVSSLEKLFLGPKLGLKLQLLMTGKTQSPMSFQTQIDS